MVKATLPPQAAPRSTPETRARNTSTTPYVVPFTVVVDTREGAPYTFEGMFENSAHAYRPRVVPVVHQGLSTGDYSIVGLTHRIAIERKSIADLMGSLAGKDGERRRRFKEEHERMAAGYHFMFGGWAHVVIEGTPEDVRAWPETVKHFGNGTAIGAHPNAVLATSVRWPRKYGVQWHWAGSRAEGERMVYRLLAEAWEEVQEEKREEQRAARRAEIERLKGQ